MRSRPFSSNLNLLGEKEKCVTKRTKSGQTFASAPYPHYIPYTDTKMACLFVHELSASASMGRFHLVCIKNHKSNLS